MNNTLIRTVRLVGEDQWRTVLAFDSNNSGSFLVGEPSGTKGPFVHKLVWVSTSIIEEAGFETEQDNPLFRIAQHLENISDHMIRQQALG